MALAGASGALRLILVSIRFDIVPTPKSVGEFCSSYNRRRKSKNIACIYVRCETLSDSRFGVMVRLARYLDLPLKDPKPA